MNDRFADFSPERRAHVLSYIQGSGLLTHPDLDDGARLLCVVGTLICDDQGRMSKSDLEDAYADPSVRQVAAQLLKEAAS